MLDKHVSKYLDVASSINEKLKIMDSKVRKFSIYKFELKI